MKLNQFLVVILSVFSIGLLTVCSSYSDSDVISEKDSARLKSYILKTYASELPPDATVEVTGYDQTDIKGFKKGNFKLTFSGRSVDLPFLIDGSGKYMILGQPISTANFVDSEVKGLKKGFIQISNRNFPILMTEDSKYIIAGEVIDTTIDVAKQTMDKITLEGVPMKGGKNAKITIVEYSDFQCPFCGRANPIIDQLMQEYKDNLRVVYKQYPLPMHNWARPASVASLCAYKLGGDEKFWNVHDKIFASQKQITLDNSKGKFMEFAKEFGLDNQKFEECLSDQTMAAKVDQEMSEGNSIGVNSTPTFVVNGIVVRGASADGLKSAIEMSMK